LCAVVFVGCCAPQSGGVRQREPERRAHAQLAARPYLAAVALHQPLDVGQADAVAVELAE